MNLSLLVVGNKYRPIMMDIYRVCKSVSREVEVGYLSEEDVVLSDFPLYFSYEFILFPIRKFALALAEYRKTHKIIGSKLVLFSAIDQEIGDNLVRSHIFDSFVQCNETGDNGYNEISHLVTNLKKLVGTKSDLLPILDSGRIKFCAYVDPYFRSSSTSAHLNFRAEEWVNEDNTTDRKIKLCGQIMYDWYWRNRMKKKIMNIRPFWGFPKSTFTERDNEFVFVLRPFCSPFDEIHDDHIKPALNRIGVECMASNDFFSANDIMADIWDNINRAYFVVADMTGRNPNVMYEIGMAHTIGKPVILITQNIDDVPFDLRGIRHIQYEYTPRGCKQLEDNLANTAKVLLREIKNTGWNENFANARLLREAKIPARFDD